MKTRPDNREHFYHAVLFCFPIIAMALVILGALVDNVLSGGGAWNLAYALAVGLVFLGGANIVRGKLPKFRAGDIFSFGVSGVPEREQRLYLRGWRQVYLGALIAVVLLTLLLAFRG